MSDADVQDATKPAPPIGARAHHRVVTGFSCDGPAHLGTYLGAIRPLVELSGDPRVTALACIGDLRTPTVPQAPDHGRDLEREFAATLLACGLHERAAVFVRSAAPAHGELARLLEHAVTTGVPPRMIRATPTVGPVGAARSPDPVLVAAEILVHRARTVPLGQDRHAYLEYTRELARRFNARYGEVLTVPDGSTPLPVARVRDLRDPTRMMGEPGPGRGGTGVVVRLLDTPVRIAAAIRTAVTDLDPVLHYDPDLRPGIANLAEILAVLTGTAPQSALRGLYGAGSLRTAVTEAVVETLRPIRVRHAELVSDPGALDARLSRGASAAAASGAPTVRAVRRALAASDSPGPTASAASDVPAP
jgi:tryptophanyl-tRNA synthetase